MGTNLWPNRLDKWRPHREAINLDLGRFKSSFLRPLCYLSCWAIASCYELMKPENKIQYIKTYSETGELFEYTVSITNHVGWQVLRSVTTVVKTILSNRPFDLKIRSGTCCIRGCTLIIISGWYFISPLATSLKHYRIRWSYFTNTTAIFNNTYNSGQKQETTYYITWTKIRNTFQRKKIKKAKHS